MFIRLRADNSHILNASDDNFFFELNGNGIDDNENYLLINKENIVYLGFTLGVEGWELFVLYSSSINY